MAKEAVSVPLSNIKRQQDVARRGVVDAVAIEDEVPDIGGEIVLRKCAFGVE